MLLTEVRLGMLPDAGSVRLPRLLPAHIAREMLLTSRRMSAAEAHRWGLVNRVVAAGTLLDEARALATEIAAAAPLSIAAILDIDRRTGSLPIGEAMAALPRLTSYRRAIDSEDAVEGPRAFAEKREPVWRGR
jgi:crotonobetainyl-CoA hydratase